MNNITRIQSSYGGVPVYESAVKNGKKYPEVGHAIQDKTDHIELSVSSHEFQQLYKKIMDIPETRIPLVEDIKQRIKISDYPLENALNETLRKLVEYNII